MTGAKEEVFRYQQILDLAPAVIYLKDKKGRYTFINKHFELLSGLSADHVLGKTDFELFSKKVAVNSTNNDMKVLKSGKPLEVEEFGPVGEELHTFISSKYPLFDDSGRIVELCGISTDITARKQAERSLKESEDRFRVAVEAAPDPILLCDQQQRVVYCNPAYTRVFGWNLDESRGRLLDESIPEEDRHKISTLVKALFSEKTFPVTETRHLAKDDRQLTVEITGGVYGNESGEPVGCILNIRDTSIQKLLQRQIQQAKRLESLGRLAGGIAHNFNNLLMGIQGSAELIKLDNEPKLRTDENVLNIFKCVRSGAELIQQLLGMAGNGKYVPESLDINENIRHCLEKFCHNARGIQIDWNLEKGVWEIKADRVQIHMVLTSLFNHAEQAMPQGGCLFVSSENIVLRETAKVHNLPSGRFVKISISDTGCAMDQNTQEHIFDPFYTTLSMSSGEGLGLAAAYGIARNHGGVITIESIHGKGTTFHVYFPAVNSQSPVQNEKPINRRREERNDNRPYPTIDAGLEKYDAAADKLTKPVK